MRPREESIRALIERAAGERPDAPALLGLEAAPLSYRQLKELVWEAAAGLAGMGVGEEARVALVTSNGPAAAAAFLSIAACGGCAPLNAAYREEEFRFYLEDLRPALLVQERGTGEAAARAARALGIRVCRLDPEPAKGAGWFRLEGAAEGAEARFGGPEAKALYLHTSGTTSRPKLVPLTQRNLLASARNVAETLGLRREDRCLNVMPLFHIHGLVAAVLASLEAGASVACAPGFQATRFFDWLEEFGPTWYTAVPTMHHAIAERAGLCAEQAARARLRLVRSSSAPLAPQVMARIEEIFGAPLVEAYGMTEAAHQMACNPLPPGARKPGSVGLPAGPEVAVMDGCGRLLEQGGRGEIVIRGDNVTAGYAANAEANRQAFTEGWFRTGDEGYFDADGYLFLTGRLKEMINRGGEKIAPREIDEALLDHPAVAQALAFGVPDERLGEEIAAAVVLRPDGQASEDELQDFAAARLADFKVPRRIVFLKEIPKGPTGKPQRIAMAARLGVATVARAGAPAGAGDDGVVRAVVEIFKQVLRREDVAADSHFFELGGDSILAAQAMSRVNALSGGAYNVIHLFRSPTPGALASMLETPRAAAAPEQRRTAGPDPSRLSQAQERMLFLQEYEEEPRLFNRPAYLRLRGSIEPGAMRAAWDDVVARHGALRTGFHKEGSQWQARVAGAAECPFEWRDLRALAGAGAEADAAAARWLAEPFDLGRPPLIRTLLMQVGDGEFRLAVSMHHLVSDGWSSRVVFRDLFEAYNARAAGRRPELPALEAAHGDYVRWLEAVEQGPLLEYWQRQMEGAPALLELPLDFPRPARPASRSADVTLRLEAELALALGRVAAAQGASLFIVLMAAFQALLARISGVTDLVVGFPAAGRTRPEFEPLCGLFCGTLPLRASLAGNPRFTEHLARTRDAVLEALAHQELPFEKLLEALRVPRNASHAPLVQAMFQLRNVPIEAKGPDGCEVEPLECSTGLLPVELSLEARETGAGLECRLTYLLDLFRPETAREILDAYGCLLRSVAASPEARLGELRLLAEGREAEVDCWRGESRPVGEPVVYEMLKTAAACPDRTAFVCGSRSITYAGYLEVARQTAALLRNAGVEPGGRVALMVRRSEKLPAYLLGIWLAGCCIVPVDPASPARRVGFLLEDAGACVLLTESGSAAVPPSAPCRCLSLDGLPEADVPVPAPVLAGTSPACVIYTSGSTGQPKGAEILHGGMRNVLDWLARVIPLAAEDVVVNVASFSFDASFADFYLAPALGATVFIAGEEEARGGAPLAELLDRCGATYLNVTPTAFTTVLESGWAGSRRLKALSGGEALSPQLAAALLARVGAVWNVYGPTETTDISVGGRPDSAGGPVSLGAPVDNTELYILDAWGAPALPGLPGELHIGGAGLASGYLNRPELTAERFVFLDTAGGRRRVYRTGDVVRRLPGGTLEYLGRIDHQIKVRGHRVELVEIEAALLDCLGVSAAVVVLQTQVAGGPRLAAFFSSDSLAPVWPGRLKEALRAKLPEYMVPGLIHQVESWPRTSSGKIDRKALELISPAAAAEGPSPDNLTVTEARILGLFGEVLGRGDLKPDDDFFDAGGHSLLAVRFVNLLAARMKQRISLRQFFADSTARAVAARLDGRAEAAGRDALR